MLSDVLDVFTAGAAVVTAGAVAIGVKQLRLAREEADRQRQRDQTSFEDDLSREYRALVGELPVEAFFADLSHADLEPYRRSFYRYFDLSNEQLFYAAKGRVSEQTRSQWEDGIAANLDRPAFRSAWSDLLPHLNPSTFEDLRTLRATRDIDPARLERGKPAGAP